ncbi:MAG: response regulator [Candidatus Sungbacteria bacterium]|nr:response regulator [bacterium]MDZ4299646.1 response regulator [Candidatus Sungbacteria bacterium]
MKILIVDDSASDRKRLKDGLISSGYNGSTILLAEDALRAREILIRESREIACVVVDYHMPGLSGDNFIRFVRKFYPGIKTVLVGVEKDVLGAGNAAGAHAAVQKIPQNSVAIVNAVNHLISFHSTTVHT